MSEGTERERDTTRIDRRQAMKAALGGAAAAAVLTAPRIEGFSFAPDFAAASSQCAENTQVGGTSTLTKTSPRCNSCSLCCWGTVDSIGCLPGNCHDTVVAGSIIVPAASGNFTSPQVTAAVKGQVKRAPGALNPGLVTVMLSDFTVNEPFASCTVAISGSCTAGSTFNTSAPSTVFTQNASFDSNIWCSGGGLTPRGTVTIAVTCVCGPD